MPASFFERDGNACYNSIAMIDADGSIMGIYRKAHIPDGIGYQEKYYFSPGSVGFKV
ncbi:carbon-nitrogen hydrolase family protein [Francisella tularensis subsp. holarctica]|uniref:Beta-alanine synthase or beta-ureidopropionase n=1 Tax=Francisella tularensis subsp. holarctica (strain LVS) TaxID=376619 RepID=A0AAI8BFY0_FRATH|nr:carbon-nitrogen hydrolase family protein [Francisella tularensis subsp. holarctica]AJI58163.1 carbon-nitrogen hydrolase family protein [Francisella tularensis subsp. holarctica LVS]AJI65534.1 carbon-nitrogen hydrolase family protein [Francisella tularensis subsp. holarctica]CAJ78944.1 beta-alanine synthase or beta-ureidopropionase [Francisella tularensis subsp. holarctica LVS]